MPIRAIAVWGLAGLAGPLACASPPQEDSTALVEPEPEPQPAEPWPAPEPVIVEAPQPSVASNAPAQTEPSPEPAPAAITNIPVCDEYLSLYQRCEAYLKPQIMAGDRRFYTAEAARLQHFAGTSEAAGLPQSCRGMLDALHVDCPPQHRQPPESAK